MEIKYFKTGDLVPYAQNNRLHPKSQIEHIKNSITKFGFTAPLLIDKKKVIVAGHARHQAAQEMGINELPCVVLLDLTPTEIKALRILDNKLALDSEWDWPNLQQELEDLKLDNFDLNNIGLVFEEAPEFEPPDDLRPANKKEITCPSCGHEFEQ